MKLARLQVHARQMDEANGAMIGRFWTELRENTQSRFIAGVNIINFNHDI